MTLEPIESETALEMYDFSVRIGKIANANHEVQTSRRTAV